MSTTSLTRTTDDIRAEIARQPILQPGEAGWWQVYGATVRDIQPGDFVITSEWDFHCQGVYEAKSALVRQGVIEDGDRYTIGKGCRVKVLRRGTHATLSPYVR